MKPVHFKKKYLKYNDIYYIRSEENLGFSGGNNLGIKYALDDGADYVLLINNDTVLDPYMLEKLFENANSQTVLTSKILYYDHPDIIWCEGGSINWNKGTSYNGKTKQKDSNNTQKYYCDFTSGCCLLIPKEIIQKVGLLRDDYFMYCEDTEYCIRLKQAGYKIEVIPEARLYHKVSASSGGEESPFSAYYISRNRLRMVTHYHDLFGKRAFAFSVITRFIRSMQYSLKGSKNGKAIRLAIRDFKAGKSGKANYPEIGV